MSGICEQGCYKNTEQSKFALSQSVSDNSKSIFGISCDDCEKNRKSMSKMMKDYKSTGETSEKKFKAKKGLGSGSRALSNTEYGI